MHSNSLLEGASRIGALRLPERPRLARWLTPVELGDDRVQLRAADFALTLSEPLLARAYRKVAPYVDGSRSVEEICAVAAPEFMGGTIQFLLKMLWQAGALHEAQMAPGVDPALRVRLEPAIQLFSHYSRTPERILERLQQSVVVVRGSAPLGLRLHAALEALGVGRVAQAEQPAREEGLPAGAAEAVDLTIALSETTNGRFFEAVNAAQMASRERWLRVAFEGCVGVVGPTIVPGQTACYTCYARRRTTHESLDGYARYQQHVESEGYPDEGALAGLTDVVIGQTALEVVRLLTALAAPATLARCHCFRADTPRVTSHDVLRVPRCPSCGVRHAPRDPWDSRAARESERH